MLDVPIRDKTLLKGTELGAVDSELGERSLDFQAPIKALHRF